MLWITYSPLRQQLEGFEKQMQNRFGDQAKERHTLVHEIHHLQQLNQTLAQQALDLTEALLRQQQTAGQLGRGDPWANFRRI